MNLKLMSRIVDFGLNVIDYCKFINISLKFECGFIYCRLQIVRGQMKVKLFVQLFV